MCTGAEIGLILAASGAAINTGNQYAAARKQDQLAARGIKNQGEIQKKASSRLNEQLTDFSQSDPSAERAQALQGYANALRGSQESTEGALPMVGAANPRFAENVGQQRGAINSELGTRAGRMASIDAPMLQRLREGQQMNRTSADLGEFNRQSGAEDFLTRLRVAAAQPNPWVGAAGSIMQGVGTGMAMMPPGAAATTAGAPATAAAVSPTAMTNQTLQGVRVANNPFLRFGGTSTLGVPF